MYLLINSVIIPLICAKLPASYNAMFGMISNGFGPGFIQGLILKDTRIKGKKLKGSGWPIS